MPRTPRILRALLATLAVGAAAAPAPAAQASSITVGRTPAPPSAVLNDGQHALTWNATIDFTGSVPDRYTVDVRQLMPSASSCLDSANPRPAWFGASAQTYSLTGYSGSEYRTGAQNLTVPAGAAQQRYCLNVTYFENGKAVFSSRAGVAFDIAQSTGTVVLVSYEDLNGDGNRQANEPGLSGWNWQVISPAADGVTRDTNLFATTADGSYTIFDAITGPWQTSEILPNPNPENWTLTTAQGENFTLSSGETRHVQVGQIRPTRICGRAFADANNNGHVDGADRAFAGVAMHLDGRTGKGEAVSADTSTDQTGAYCFGPLMPGTYTVTEAIPADHVPTFDKDGPGNGLNYIAPITVVSGVPSSDNDFALAPVVRVPQTKLCLTKSANRKRVRQGSTVTWTLKVRNCGKAVAAKTTVNDPLLADTTLGSRKGATLVRGELIWRAGELKPGQSKTYKFTVRFDRDARVGTHTNKARAESASAPTVNAKRSVRVLKKKRAPKKVAVTG